MKTIERIKRGALHHWDYTIRDWCGFILFGIACILGIFIPLAALMLLIDLIPWPHHLWILPIFVGIPWFLWNCYSWGKDLEE